MRRFVYSIAFCFAGMAANAESLCTAQDPADVLAGLSGSWSREGAISVENATVSELRRIRDETLVISDEGGYRTGLVEDLIGGDVALVLSDVPPYDVDGVDDILDTVQRADLADILSDTPCGPETLPQFVATLAVLDGVEVTGTITLIPYFTDRVLEVTELELKASDTILFLTGAALLRPQIGDQ